MYQGRLTRQEQETIVNYNQEDKTASCFTCDQSLIRKLDILCEKSSEIIVTKIGDGCKEYSFPKRWVKIKMPRQLSDEQRQKAAERAARNFGSAREKKSDEK